VIARRLLQALGHEPVEDEAEVGREG
jgi:hypothetical protein